MSFEMSREQDPFACKSGSLVGFGGPQVSQRRPTIHPTVLRPNSPALMPVYFSPPPWQLYKYTTETLVWPYHVLNYSCLEMSRYFMRNSGGNKEDARRRAEVSQDQVSHGLLTTHYFMRQSCFTFGLRTILKLGQLYNIFAIEYA